MTTSPGKDNPCDPAEMQLRQDLLDDLYRRDGRDRKHHPHHSTYTNLWQSWTTPQTPNS